MYKAGEHCIGCPAFEWEGYVPPEGYPKNGVVLVGEAPGEDEAKAGRPFVGRSGTWLTQTLQRGGYDRGDFGVANVLRSRPPGNVIPKDTGHLAILHCAPLLDRTLADWKPKSIVALGDTALGRLTGLTGITKQRGYVHQTRYGWVVPTYHPSYILRGKFNLTNVFLWDIGRAVRVAKDGYKYGVRDRYLLDPTLPEFEGWVAAYERAVAKDPQMALAVDIETPGKGDDEGELEVDDPSYIILRIGFAYGQGEAVSLPWVPELKPLVKRLLRNKHEKLVHNGAYDLPRLVANDCTIGGTVHDTMVAWHVLNSDLPKGLGFIAPFAAEDQEPWKHLSHDKPAYYNATDCYVTDMVWQMVQKGLRTNKMWDVYDRDILQLDPILSEMSAAGMPIDPVERRKSAEKLEGLMEEVNTKIQVHVPVELKPLHPKEGWAKEPEDKTGMRQIGVSKSVKVCGNCGEIVSAAKKHTKKSTKKTHNPCADAPISIEDRNISRWATVLPFTPSSKQLLNYGKAKGHPVVLDKKKDGTKTPTTNEKALKSLLNKTGDILYAHVLDYRELEKLQGTYIGRPDPDDRVAVSGGFPVGKDGLVHTVFKHDPSTLRLSSAAPNMQNLPRVGASEDDVQNLVKGMFVAPEGYSFYGVDFAGIEALLVFWLAQSKRGVRLAKMGVHDYFVSHLIGEPADDHWDDATLENYLGEMKRREKKLGNATRDPAKRTIHAAHYLVTGHKLWMEFPHLYDSPKKAQWYIDFYLDLMPEVRKWHRDTLELAERQGFLRCADGFVARFYRVFEWYKKNGVWDRKEGETAKAAIAFQPQHLAATIMKESLRDLAKMPAMRRTLRLTIHDEIFGIERDEWLDETISVVESVMQKQRLYLPLDPEWGYGDYLSVGTEGKKGHNWGKMK